MTSFWRRLQCVAILSTLRLDISSFVLQDPRNISADNTVFSNPFFISETNHSAGVTWSADNPAPVQMGTEWSGRRSWKLRGTFTRTSIFDIHERSGSAIDAVDPMSLIDKGQSTKHSRNIVPYGNMLSFSEMWRKYLNFFETCNAPTSCECHM